MIKSLMEIGNIGVLNDPDEYDLPINAFTDARNVRFNDGNMEKFSGETWVYKSSEGVSISTAPYGLFPVPTTSTYYWIYAGTQHIYAVEGTNHTLITPKVVAPSAACVSALAGAGAGNLSNGVYSYKIAFINGFGKTTAGPVSNTTTVVDNAADGQIALTSIPVSNDPTVTGRTIYRTTAGGSTYKYVTNINDNTTTTYTDNIADASLGLDEQSSSWASVVSTGAPSDIWNGGVISSIPVINNGVDSPLQWTPVATSQPLTFLPWDSGNSWRELGYTASVIRVYREFLIALGMTEGGNYLPHKLRWSTATAVGATPITWDDTDASEDAGFTEFSESGGHLVDCLPLRTVNIIYKEDMTIAQSFIGGNDIFNFTTIFTETGLLATNCVAEFFGSHLCLTTGDVIVHDGNTIRSIVNKKMQRWLFNQIDSTNYANSFVVPNHPKNEVWICFPPSGETWSKLALVWNYREDTIAVRELAGFSIGAYGVVDPSETATFDADIGTFDSDDTNFDARSYNPTIKKILMADPTQIYLTQMDDTNQFNGVNFTSYVEKLGLDFGEPGVRKRIKRIYPRVESTTPLTIKIGSENVRGEGVNWTSYTFDPSSRDFINVRKTGRFFGFRVETTSNFPWKFHSIDFEYEVTGYR